MTGNSLKFEKNEIKSGVEAITTNIGGTESKRPVSKHI